MGDMALRRRGKLKCLFLICLVSTIIVMLLTHVAWKKSSFDSFVGKTNYSWFFDRPSTGNPSATSIQSSTATNLSFQLSTPVTLFVRMAGKLLEHKRRYYCDLFRTTVLFWPPSFGKTVLVLDEESEQDHVFGENITQQTREYFPEHKLEVFYEPLPEDPNVLNFAGMPKPAGYNRQLWSSFFIDLYTNDSIIAWMDNDAAFITPVTKSSIFNGTKLRVLGSECSLADNWVKTWAQTTELALGVPFVVDFMTYFPVYIYRDTFTHCREHILRRFSTNNFGEAFRKFYQAYISPVSIILSYAWFFEKDRYDWNMKICANLGEYNKRFPTGHTIGPEHIGDILSEPQTTFHVPYAEFLFSNVLVSYCLSHKAAGNNLDLCSNHSFSVNNNLVLFNSDLQRVQNEEQSPCTGNNTSLCWQVLERHYNQIGLEIKQNWRQLDWRNVETVEKLANEMDIKCRPINH